MSLTAGAVRDLVVLVADKNAEAALNGAFGRPEALAIRRITWRIFVHPERDPGCFLRSHTVLSAQRSRFAHALVLFDHQGCGREGLGQMELERDVEGRLRDSGWGDRAAAVCLDPELECWVWSDSPGVDVALGWASRQPDLRSWLAARGLWEAGKPKPADPKKAVEAALYEVRKPRSSAIYRQLAERVSLQRCSDPAFQRLCQVLRTWFPT